ncbi:MAG: hypothetical protein H7Y38_16120 [Armatimonadetes bacterium]|nr:hypothetical protein [Armatimonadota bacterium]
MPTLRLEEYAFRIMENQLRMQEWLESHQFNWGLDLTAGRLTFKDAATGAPIADLPMQLIGSQSDETNTWLWSWANENGGDGLPSSVTRLAASVRDFAAASGADSRFTNADTFPLPDANFGYEMSTVCAGFGGAFGYYRCPYDGGAAWVVIEAFPEAAAFPASPLLPTKAITGAISTFTLDHRAATQAYLGTPDASGVYANGMTVTFDAQGRIGNMQMTLNPAPKPASPLDAVKRFFGG